MENNYSLSDIAAVSDGNGFGNGNSAWVLIILFAMIFGNGGFGYNRPGEFGQYATAASQQEILFGQQFQNIDNKMDRGFTSIGNGISSATFSLNNSIKDGNAAVAGAVVSEGRALQSQVADGFCATNKNIDSVRFDMSNYASQINATATANTQKILDAISVNRMADMQNQINQLQLQAAMCGVVRYPNGMTYNAGSSPFCNCNSCCGCNNL